MTKMPQQRTVGFAQTLPRDFPLHMVGFRQIHSDETAQMPRQYMLFMNAGIRALIFQKCEGQAVIMG